MVLIAKKIHFTYIELEFIDLTIKYIKEVKISGITFGRNLNLNTNIKNVSRKAGQKLSILLMISFNLDKRKQNLFKKTISKISV